MLMHVVAGFTGGRAEFGVSPELREASRPPTTYFVRWGGFVAAVVC